jgi:hypothetical protein
MHFVEISYSPQEKSIQDVLSQAMETNTKVSNPEL